jgi:hypothetical protein
MEKCEQLQHFNSKAPKCYNSGELLWAKAAASTLFGIGNTRATKRKLISPISNVRKRIDIDNKGLRDLVRPQ